MNDTNIRFYRPRRNGIIKWTVPNVTGIIDSTEPIKRVSVRLNGKYIGNATAGTLMSLDERLRRNNRTDYLNKGFTFSLIPYLHKPKTGANHLTIEVITTTKRRYTKTIKFLNPIDYSTLLGRWLARHEAACALKPHKGVSFTIIIICHKGTTVTWLKRNLESLTKSLDYHKLQSSRANHCNVAIVAARTFSGIERATEPLDKAGIVWDAVVNIADIPRNFYAEYIIPVSARGTFAKTAITELSKFIHDTKPDIAYTDEALYKDDGTVDTIWLRPAWSPNLLLSQLYFVHLTAIRKSIFLKAHGHRFESTDYCTMIYKLLLRLTEITDSIRRLPRVLYKWAPGGNKYPKEGATALKEAIRRRRLRATVTKGEVQGTWRVKYKLQNQPLVSIVIPTGGNKEFIKTCLRSLFNKTTYKNYEVIIVDNSKQDELQSVIGEFNDYGRPACPDYRRNAGRRVRLLGKYRYLIPFNFSKLVNYGARNAKGEYLILLNDDILITTPSWIEAMLEHAQREDVGAVGVRLLYPSRAIQHAGVVIIPSKIAEHTFRFHPPKGDCANMLSSVRECSSVTAACYMIRKRLFFRVGGLDDEFYGFSWNDFDLNQKLRKLSYSILYTPYATLIHNETVTRSFIDETPIVRELSRKWKAVTKQDEYYNPNYAQHALFATHYLDL